MLVFVFDAGIIQLFLIVIVKYVMSLLQRRVTKALVIELASSTAL